MTTPTAPPTVTRPARKVPVWLGVLIALAACLAYYLLTHSPQWLEQVNPHPTPSVSTSLNVR